MIPVLNSPLIPSLLAFVSVTMAAYVLVDVIGFVSARYRDRYLAEARLELDDILIQMPAGRVLDLSLGLSALVLLLTVLFTVWLNPGSSWSGGVAIGLLAAALVFGLWCADCRDCVAGSAGAGGGASDTEFF